MRQAVLWLACALAVFSWSQEAFSKPVQLPMVKAQVGGAKLLVELATTGATRYQGLSGRRNLPWQRGMLFVFPNPRRATFVMRNMLMSLDFIWIKQGKVVGLNRVVPPPKPGEEPRQIPSPGLVDRVLEVNAGWIDAHRIKTGDSFKLLN